MATRFNVYLPNDVEDLFEELVNNINAEREMEYNHSKKDCAIIKRYKPIGKSEVIQQLIKKFYKKEKNILIDKLDYHCRQAEIYETKLNQMKKLKDE